MNKTKMLSLAVAFAMLLSVVFPAGVVRASDFSDIEGHYAKAVVEKWSKTGIVSGYNQKFRPNDSITRGEIAVILNNLMKYQMKSPNQFKDLSEAFYTDAILKANASGIIHGSKDRVRPLDNATREETVVMLAKALGVDKKSSSTVTFRDSTAIADWAIEYVNAFSENKYVSGRGQNNFYPKANITRAEVLVIINNIISAFYHKEGTYTENAEGSVIINASDVVLKDMTIKGNLIIAEGVGDGDVTLDNVKVQGKTFVRGGGENSIKIIGDSVIANMVVSRIDGQIRVVAEGNATIAVVTIDDGSDDVILEGKIQKVEIKAGNIVVKSQKAQIETVVIDSSGTEFVVDKDTQISDMNITKGSQKVKIDVSGHVANLLVKAAATEVKGDGKVENASIQADHVVIDTTGTKLEVAKNVTGTSSNGQEIESGSSITTGQTPELPVFPVLPGNGGGGPTGETPSTPSPKITDVDVVGNDGETVENIKVGDELYAKITPAEAQAAYSWKTTCTVWQEGKPVMVTKEVGTGKSYILAPEDQGKKLSLTVKGSENYEKTIDVSGYVGHNILKTSKKASAAPAMIELNNGEGADITVTLPEGISFKDELPKEFYAVANVSRDQTGKVDTGILKRIDDRTIKVVIIYEPGTDTSTEFHLVISAGLLKDTIYSVETEALVAVLPGNLHINIADEEGERVTAPKVGDTLYAKVLNNL